MDYNLRVRLGFKVIGYNEPVPLEAFQNAIPEISYNSSPGYYTVILVDRDAPSPKDPKNRWWVHWLKINIPRNVVPDGETIVAYQAPSPPAGTGYHRYYFYLYKQPSLIKITDTIPREKFDRKAFETKHGLETVGKMKFITKRSDSS